MGFVEMGIVVEHVTTLKPGPKFTLAMLADRADRKGRTDGKVECWPSIRELVRRTAQSKSTVLRQLSYLNEIGIIDVEKRWYTDESGQARQATNKYIINLPGIQQGDFMEITATEVEDSAGSTDSRPMGVKMTLKPKTPGQGKGVNLTPKGEYGCQKPQSLGVTGDTPRKININTNPSPSVPLGDADEEPGVGAGGATAPGAGKSPIAETPSVAHENQIADDAGAPNGPSPDGPQGAPEAISRGTPAGLLDLSSLEGACGENPASGGSHGASGEDFSRSDGSKTHQKAPLAEETPSGGTSTHLKGFGAGNRDSRELHDDQGSGESASSDREISRDWELIYQALPESMQDLPPREVPAIAEMIRLRLRGGWSLACLRKTLASRALPSEVRYLPGLVKVRLRDDVPPHAAPPRKGNRRGDGPTAHRAATSPRPDELLTPQQRVQARQYRRALIDQALSKKQHHQRNQQQEGEAG